ncbi:MAG: 1-deoxy-D-xylulose-5-phosphate reductoisomerase [Actinobacteria bacterium 21-64-8]|nr:MAG: 1-deoxy-D-xylulose-5-phosphate reductoisomerase [Actinobacteria bacterium 21-64-8]
MVPSHRRVALLGATGSIGRQSLEVLRREPDRFDLVAISGGEQLAELAAIQREFGVSWVGVKSPAHRERLALLVDESVEILVGDEGLRQLAQSADVVVNAVMGFAGLPVTIGALEAGVRLALANKESLIAGAPLVERARATPGAELVPVDSEHCAIYQCLVGASAQRGRPDVRRLLLTASGGPFRGMSSAQLQHVTREDALRHPTWSMGDKITVDSSTLMNKGLEVLEASALFGVEVARIDVVVHPQSVVHSMVEFVDGSILAQLSNPDMRLPIAYSLGLPERLDHRWGALDFSSGVELTFEAPDRSSFRALDLAYEAARLGGAAPAWLSAANEVAVDAFLARRIQWCDLVPLVATVMEHYESDELATLGALYENDATARRLATGNLPH